MPIAVQHFWGFWPDAEKRRHSSLQLTLGLVKFGDSVGFGDR
jgi:hypothetical protein